MCIILYGPSGQAARPVDIYILRCFPTQCALPHRSYDTAKMQSFHQHQMSALDKALGHAGFAYAHNRGFLVLIPKGEIVRDVQAQCPNEDGCGFWIGTRFPKLAVDPMGQRLALWRTGWDPPAFKCLGQLQSRHRC